MLLQTACTAHTRYLSVTEDIIFAEDSQVVATQLEYHRLSHSLLRRYPGLQFVPKLKLGF